MDLVSHVEGFVPKEEPLVVETLLRRGERISFRVYCPPTAVSQLHIGAVVLVGGRPCEIERIELGAADSYEVPLDLTVLVRE